MLTEWDVVQEIDDYLVCRNIIQKFVGSGSSVTVRYLFLPSSASSIFLVFQTAIFVKCILRSPSLTIKSLLTNSRASDISSIKLSNMCHCMCSRNQEKPNYSIKRPQLITKTTKTRDDNKNHSACISVYSSFFFSFIIIFFSSILFLRRRVLLFLFLYSFRC